MAKKSKVVKFSDLKVNTIDSEGQLTDLVDKTFTIVNIEWQTSDLYGDFAIVEGRIGNKKFRRHTFSKVLLKQLKVIGEELAKGNLVEVTLTKRKRYYTFE